MLSTSVSGHTYYDLGPIISYPTEIRPETPTGSVGQSEGLSGDRRDQKSSSYTYVAEVSAYTASDDQCGKSDGVTASGTHAKQGRTIAAPSWIPFGTTVVVNGVSYVCEDRGGYISDNRLDIYMDSREDAVEFGRKELEVTVVW